MTVCDILIIHFRKGHLKNVLWREKALFQISLSVPVNSSVIHSQQYETLIFNKIIFWNLKRLWRERYSFTVSALKRLYRKGHDTASSQRQQVFHLSLTGTCSRTCYVVGVCSFIYPVSIHCRISPCAEDR